ncbi:MFS-type efflux pump MSMEG_3705-like [Apostichopus japonicus]|uniref:MFS-type efflux pump MSMEG_3705-like n=1 Tax=Stichopus japonicus TaxID=307972 RepID=UPI003AB764EB
MDNPYLEQSVDETQSLFPKSRRSDYRRSVICLLVLFLAFVLTQADQQALAVLIPSGLRCYSHLNDSCEVANLVTTTQTATSISSSQHFYGSSENVIREDSRRAENRSPLSFSEQYRQELKFVSGTGVTENYANEGLCKPGNCINFSDTQQGILTGPAFTLVYSIASIPFARLADATSRVRVFLLGLLLTGLMVLLTTLSTTYLMLLLARIGLGVGTAICNPAAIALIADYFDSIDRSKALSFYHIGVYVGGAAGYALSAITTEFCWRWAFGSLAITSAVCILLALFTLHEPQRATISPLFGKTYTLKETLFRLKTCKPFLVLCIAAGIRAIGGYALGAWLATYYARVLMLPSRQFGFILAIIVFLGGGMSSLVAGYLADKCSEDHRPAKAYIITITQLLAIPFTVAALLVHDPRVSYSMLFLAYLAAETWLGVASAIVQDLFSPSIRTQATAIYITVYTIIGGCIGPILVPVIMNASPEWSYCDRGVGQSLSIVVTFSYIVSAVFFAILGYLMKNEEPPSDEAIVMSYETSDMEQDISTEASYHA